jgi:peptide chain release factor 1
MVERAKQMIDRHGLLEQEMASSAVAADPKKLETLGREYQELGRSLPVLREYVKATEELGQAREILKSERDPDMLELAESEVLALEERLADLEQGVRKILVPKDPNDAKNAIVEIRAGTGGVEAGLFAADLLRMYSHYVESRGWRMEVLNTSPGDLGGIKEIVFMVHGEGAYGTLKFESGVHRVQRVPQTESQGRIHTSAASVAVFPEADEIEVDIDPHDLRIDVYRSSGPGGQSVNTTDSAVRVVHVPTGITVTCQDEKSQHKNKARALKVLKSRILDIQLAEREAKATATRRSMVGTGDRSAKIRTYNFPQGRVTDHRINLTLYRLEEIISGSLQEVVDALSTADLDERVKATGTQPGGETPSP